MIEVRNLWEMDAFQLSCIYESVRILLKWDSKMLYSGQLLGDTNACGSETNYTSHKKVGALLGLMLSSVSIHYV